MSITKDKCKNCSEYKKCKSSRISWIFVAIGMIAAASIRLITVLIYFDSIYGKIAWYVGVGGFLVFFAYKYKIFKSRSIIITKKDLIGRVKEQKQLTAEDYNIIGNILCGISSMKERINYLFIFATSAISILVAIYFDFIR